MQRAGRVCVRMTRTHKRIDAQANNDNTHHQRMVRSTTRTDDHACARTQIDAIEIIHVRTR